MTKRELLAADAPLSYFYGHPKGTQGWEDVSDVKRTKDAENQRRVKSVRSQWTVQRSVRSKKAQNWFLFHELEKFHQVEAWMRGGSLYWKWSKFSRLRDGKVHKAGKPTLAYLIRYLNGTA